MSEQMKIIQYLPLWAAEKALSAASTFCLNSIQYYIELEERLDGVGDKKELKADFDSGGGGEYIEAAIISCWSIAENQTNPTPDWEIMGGRDVAIVSTPESVSQYIKDHVRDLLNEKWFVSHEKVNYYTSTSMSDFNRRDMIFWKRQKYADQREYRFCVRRSCIGSHLETLIFRNRELETFPKYIDQVFVNPSLSKKEHKKLYYPWCCQSEAMSKFMDWENAYNT